MTPSQLRNKLEVRIRRFSSRKTRDEQLVACQESIALLQEYERKLLAMGVADYVKQLRKRARAFAEDHAEPTNAGT